MKNRKFEEAFEEFKKSAYKGLGDTPPHDGVFSYVQSQEWSREAFDRLYKSAEKVRESLGDSEDTNNALKFAGEVCNMMGLLYQEIRQGRNVPEYLDRAFRDIDSLSIQLDGYRKE